MNDNEKYLMACAHRRIQSLRSENNDLRDLIRQQSRMLRTLGKTVENLRRLVMIDAKKAAETVFK